MNGLGAAGKCADRTVVPLSGVALFNTIGGTIPSCVWSLRNLSVLHMTGNGFTGELVSSLPAFSRLTDVALSYNQLSGTIPVDMIMNVARLDLSYNQLGGEYPDYTQSTNRHLSLEINRMSGRLPVSELEQLRYHDSSSSLNVLRGNVFSCDTIPSNDEYASDYVCGSRILNYAMFGFMSAAAVVILGVILILRRGRTMSTIAATKERPRKCVTVLLSSQWCELMWKYFTCLQNLTIWNQTDRFAPALHRVVVLYSSFGDVVRCAVLLLVVVLTSSSMLYVVKALDSSFEYATHRHVYSWFWTLAFMRDVVPAGLLLMVWVVSISACFYRVVAHPLRWHDADDVDGIVGGLGKKKEMVSPTGNTEVVEVNGDVSSRGMWSTIRIGSLIILNAWLVGTVNVLYVYSSQLAFSSTVHLILQLSMSIFRMLYSAVVSPVLCRPIRDAVANVRFRFMLLAINNLLLPCLVTAFTSDACFQVRQDY